MPIIDPNFYALNGVRGYPIDDGALGQDNAGNLIPPNILVDCKLRFPESAGRYAFLGALTVTPHLVTIVFLASDHPAVPLAPDGAPVPLASLTVAAPVMPWTPYPVDVRYPGVGGWIVFGQGVEEPYDGRFTSVRQSQILPKCARPFRPLPIPSIGKEFVAGPLTGLVKVLAGADMEVFKDQREIDRQPVDCLVIRLADNLNRNVLSFYAGPCADRPESGTCTTPALELLNAVGPDCDGNINIQFRGADAVPLRGGGGLVVSLPIGLADVCAGKYLPDATGHLPTEFADLCSSESLQLSSSFAAHDLPDMPARAGRDAVATHWPAADNFAAVSLDARWSLIDGSARLAVTDRPALILGDHARRNTIVWGRDEYATAGLRCRARVRTMPGTESNGGIVVNHAIHPETGRPTYYLALANASSNSLDIWRYNGVVAVVAARVVAPADMPIRPGRDYDITAAMRTLGDNRTVLDVAINATGEDRVLRLATVMSAPAPTGRFGLGTIRSAAAFGYFELREGD
jgi:hypothetical protein